MKRRIPKAEMKRGKTLFLAKKRGNADSDLVKPTAAELLEVTRILPGALWRRNSWVVTEYPEFGQDEPIRDEGSMKRTLLFTVEYEPGNEVHEDIMTAGMNTQRPRTILDADDECVFMFKGVKTCDDSYGIVQFVMPSKLFSREGTTTCKGWVKKEMSGSV